MNPLGIFLDLVAYATGIVNALYSLIFTPFVNIPFVGDLSIAIMLFNPVFLAAVTIAVVRKKLI
jgi:hypothetical protein